MLLKNEKQEKLKQIKSNLDKIVFQRKTHTNTHTIISICFPIFSETPTLYKKVCLHFHRVQKQHPISAFYHMAKTSENLQEFRVSCSFKRIESSEAVND